MHQTSYHSGFIYFLISAQTATLWCSRGLSVCCCHTHITLWDTLTWPCFPVNQTLRFYFLLIIIKILNDYSFRAEHIYFSLPHL